MMTRRPFFSLVSVNWRLGSGAAARPSTTTAPADARRRIEGNMTPPRVISCQLLPGERTQKEAEGQTFCLESCSRRCQCDTSCHVARHSVRPSRGCGRPEADREAPCESADV